MFILITQACVPVIQQPTIGEEKAVLIEGSGQYTRPIATDSEVAQRFFDQGLRLTWAYYFPESVASYQQALEYDADNPMIYWGMALALGPNPNSRYRNMPDDPRDEATKAITHAKQLLEKATESERDFINALFVRFDKENYPDRSERDQAYLQACRALYQKYPNDPEATALYADAYMVIGKWDYWDRQGNPRPYTTEITTALENNLKLRPDHPGTNHLLIHLLEASQEPERALVSANRLEALMPGAGHIVHMPSHIYVRIGQYEDAISSNERSLAADRKFLSIWGKHSFPNTVTYPLSSRTHGPHALDFIRHAATMQGNYALAIDAARRAVVAMADAKKGPVANQSRTAAVWIIQKIFGKWDELLAEDFEPTGLPYLDGMRAFTRGSALIGVGDLDGARTQLGKLRRIAQDPAIDASPVGIAPPSALLSLALAGLEGEIEQAEGGIEAAITAFKKAVTLEDALPYFEPPEWPQPMRHYLGAALLEANRAEEAELIYRRDLSWNKNNGWALYGLWQSLTAQGKSAEAQRVLLKHKEAWKRSDMALSRSRI
ncbi:MAG: tetratricopeptide repeat protein [Gammaproteobacteria bacterium]